MSFVTIITDASYNDSLKAGGWAGRITVNGERHTFSGPIKRPVHAVNEAELIAVANTLHAGYACKALQPGDVILIQVDNLRTLGVLQIALGETVLHQRVKREATLLEKAAINVIVDLLDKNHAGTVTARHIQSHVDADKRAAKHHVHELLDRLAKRGRKEATLLLQRVAEKC